MPPKTNTTPSQSSPVKPRRSRRRRVLPLATTMLAAHHLVNCSSLATLLLLSSSRTNAFLNFQLETNTKSYRRRHDHREWRNPPSRREQQIRKRHHRWLASSGSDHTTDREEEDDDNNTASPNNDYYHVDDIDWRAFRANLVQNGISTSSSSSSLTSLTSSSSFSTSTSSPRYAYESTPLLEKGTLLLSIPTADLCQALEQQYWHKCVVLLTEVAPDPIQGELERKVPDGQLAQGKKRGWWSYRGIVLNRLMDIERDDDDDDDDDDEIQNAQENRHLQRGGDLLFGIPIRDEENETENEFSERTKPIQTTCLYYHHNKEQILPTTSMKPLLENLYTLTHQEAKQLCRTQPDLYHPRDFITFAGFCSWRPGQLEMEMTGDRMEWLALSVDGNSVWDELQLQLSELTMTTIDNGDDANHHSGIGRDDGSIEKEERARRIIDAGTNMWRNFLSKIDYSESKALNRLPSGQLQFYDEMLNVWAEDNLIVSKNHHDDVAHVKDEKGGKIIEREEIDEDSTDLGIGPGALLRSRSHCSQATPTDTSSSTSASTSTSALYPNDTLLYEQEFLKSTILVLEDTPEATVGIILNHPMPAEIDCVVGKEPLPLRYGGPMDVMSWKDGSFRYGDEEEEEEEDEKVEDCYDGDETGREHDENGPDNDEENDDNVLYDGFMDYAIDLEGNNDYFDDYDDDDDDDDDSSPFVWIHRNQFLGSLGPNNGGGTPLGSSNIYHIRENDAISALQSGLLSAKDVMVFSGVCLWEKGDDLGVCGGGLREQVDVFGVFEIVRAYNENDEDGPTDVVMDSVWDILSKQRVLRKEAFEGNVNAVISAWNSCGAIIHDINDSSKRRNVSLKDELSEAAMRAWVGVNLLDDPLGTFVEIKAK